MTLAYDALGRAGRGPAGTDPGLWARICQRVRRPHPRGLAVLEAARRRAKRAS